MNISVETPTRKTLAIYGTAPFSMFVDEAKVPIDVVYDRIPFKTNTGVVYRDENTRRIVIRGERTPVFPRFLAAVIEALKERGVTAYLSKHRRESNDIVFQKDGQQKKFCGMVENDDFFGAFITLKLDPIVGEFLRTDTIKFQQRGVKNVLDAIGGLDEVGVESDIIDSIVAKLT